MKRSLTFAMAIIATVFFALDSIFELIGVVLLIDYFEEAAIFLILILAIIIATLVFNILMIPIANKPCLVYAKKKGIIITAIVFNFLSALLAVISILAVGIYAFSVITAIILIVGVFAGVIYCVDLANEKDNAAPIQTTESQPITQSTGITLQARLATLESMKAQGLVSETEYKEIKKIYLSKEMEK